MVRLKDDKDFNKFNKIKVSTFLMLIVASFINAVGVGLLLVPAGLIDACISGASVLLSFLTPISVSIYLVILNFPLYIFAKKKFGTNFVIYSLFSIVMYSLFVFLLKDLVFAGKQFPLTDDPLLGCIFGGLLSGIGSGLTIRAGSSLDGIDVVAVYLSKKTSLTVAKLELIFNIALYLVAGCLLGWNVPLYSLIAYAIGNQATDAIVDGLDKAKAAMIITSKGDIVAEVISKEMGSGITILDGKGYYHKQNMSVLYYVVNRFEISRLKQIILSVDDKAFVAISDVADVLGANKRTFGKQVITNSKKRYKVARADLKEDINGGVEQVDQDMEDDRVKIKDETKGDKQ